MYIVINPCWKHWRRCILMSPCIYFNFMRSITFAIAVTLAVKNNPQSFKPHCSWHSTILLLSQQNRFLIIPTVSSSKELNTKSYTNISSPITAHYRCSYVPVAIIWIIWRLSFANLLSVVHKKAFYFCKLLFWQVASTVYGIISELILLWFLHH